MGTYSDLLKSKPLAKPDTPITVLDNASVPTPSPDILQANRSPERNSERTVFRSENRTVSLPLKRRTKRYSFEFYEDQLMRLKQLKLQTEMSGENVALSEMVRTALDEFLRDKT